MTNYNVGLYFTDEYYEYNFGNTHPLRPLRLELTYSLIKKLGLLENKLLHVFKPRHCTEEELTRVHSPNYVQVIQKLSVDPNDTSVRPYSYGLGPGDNPIFKGMYESSTLICGASLQAAEKVFLDEEYPITFNPAGGLHHAMRNHASGFCIFNDIGVAIAHLKTLKEDIKIAYLDIDCHHGDGVQWMFYDDPNVLTISYHEDGRYLFPGTGTIEETGKNSGAGFSINFPLQRWTTDKIFLNLFRGTFPKILETYQPDILISQLGVDTHHLDPLTQMGLSLSVYPDIAQTIKTTAKEYAYNRWLALGGGGYLMSVVPRAWALFLAKMLDVELENKLPEEWYQEFKNKVPFEKAPFYLWDRADEIQRKMLADPEIAQKMVEHRNTLIKICEEKYIPAIISHR
ncbi:MAG: acetoin utilization protein AcuC [Candidatus Lokiarchaeota archaeon]|nr:acetoin utilization protein AcuC [Candidatus Lokiarchaeota archaeon]